MIEHYCRVEPRLIKARRFFRKRCVAIGALAVEVQLVTANIDKLTRRLKLRVFEPQYYYIIDRAKDDEH